MWRFSSILLFIFGAPVFLFLTLSVPFNGWSGQAVRAQDFISPEVTTSGIGVFAALPEEGAVYSYNIQVGDARKIILTNYLHSKDSPLVNYVDELIAAADHYQLDFRLLVAISRQESNMCKIIPENTFNCWGWGVHELGTLGFDDYSHGIWTVAQGLREKYLNDGLVSPEQIMTRYTPSSPGSWAAGVNQFMAEME